MNKETVTYLEQLQIDEKRKELKQLLFKPTRVQLGRKVVIAGIETFKVEYELTDGVSLEEIEKAKEETGLTVLFITLVSKLDIETERHDDVERFDSSIGYRHAYTYVSAVVHQPTDLERTF